MIGPLLDDGGDPIVDISGGATAADSQASGSASASISVESDGDIMSINTGGSVDQSDWITPKSSAPGAYEIMVHQDTGDALDGTSDALDTWLALTSNRIWGVTQTGAGVKSATLTASIRLGTTVLSQGAFIIGAEVLT